MIAENEQKGMWLSNFSRTYITPCEYAIHMVDDNCFRNIESRIAL